MSANEEKFKVDDSHLKSLMENAEINQSFYRAMQIVSAAEQIRNVASVMKFITKNISTDNAEKRDLIEANLKYLATQLNNYHVRLYDNAENVQYPYHIDERRALEAKWVNCGMRLHKMAHIIIKKSIHTPHSPNIFYALYILKGLCLGQNPQLIAKIISETNVIETIFTILGSDANSNNINTTWIEQFICVQLLRFLCVSFQDDDKSLWIQWSEKYNLNIMKLLIKISVNCFLKLPYYYRTMQEYQKKLVLLVHNIDLQDKSQIKSQDDIPTYLRSGFTQQNLVTRSLHYWCYQCRISSLQILKYLAGKMWTKESFMSGITAQYLKRLLQITSMTMRQGKQTFPPQVNAIDVMVILSQNEHIAKTIVSDDEIMKTLIVCIRSRGTVCEFNNANLLVLIYFITVQHKVLPRQYFNDVIYALMDTTENEWKNINMLRMINLPSTNELTIRTLKYLFGVPSFSMLDREHYLCVICQSVFNNPHTLPCGHTMCYCCLTGLLGSIYTNYEAHFSNVSKPNLCPICRKEFKGKFDRDDKKSAFTLNYALQNEMNAAQIVMDDDTDTTYDDFKGTECDFWSYLKTKHVNSLYDQQMANMDKVRAEFITFCTFMQQNTRVYKGNIQAERKENILKARDIKAEGNELFKSKDYKAAILKYKEALAVCPLFVVERGKFLSNITLCYIKLSDYVAAYRTAQNALMILHSHIKLVNHCITALSKLLFEDEERSKLNTHLHDKLSVSACNASCLTRRVYDILLYQLLWECEFMYCLKKIKNGNDNQKYADNLRKTDDFIQNIRNIDGKIANIGDMNFDEYQYLTYIECKNRLKQKMHKFMVDALCEEKKGLRNIVTDAIDDLLYVFDEENISMLSVQQLVQRINLKLKQDKCCEFYSKWITYNVVKFIARKSQMLQIVRNSSGTYVKLSVDFTQNKMEYEKTKDEEKIQLFNDWNENNDDFITSALYIWEFRDYLIDCD